MSSRKKSKQEDYLFVDDLWSRDLVVLLLPVLVVILSINIGPFLSKETIEYKQLIFNVIIVILIVTDLIMIFSIYFYKIIGTRSKIYVLKFGRYKAINLSGIKSVGFDSVRENHHNCNLFLEHKRYHLIISKKEEFVEYLKERKEERKKGEIANDLNNDRIIFSSIFVSQFLFIITMNILPVAFLLMRTLSIRHYWYFYKFASLSWILYLCAIPPVLLILFCVIRKKLITIGRSKYVLPTIVLSVILLSTLFLIVIYNISKSTRFSYEKKDVEDVENIIEFDFPEKSLFETQDTPFGKMSVVTIKKDNNFQELFAKIEESDVWVKNISDGVPEEVRMIMIDKGMDYYLVYSVEQSAYNDDIIFDIQGKYIVISVSSETDRFFIYDFTIVLNN